LPTGSVAKQNLSHKPQFAVQGVVGKSGERGSQNFYLNGSQDFHHIEKKKI